MKRLLNKKTLPALIALALAPFSGLLAQTAEESGDKPYGLLYLAVGLLSLIAVFALRLVDRTMKANNIKSSFNWQYANRVLLGLGYIGLFAFIIYQLVEYGGKAYQPLGSEHAYGIRDMINITFVITGIVFVITQTLLFFFSAMYAKHEGKKAYYYAVNDKLELIWTIIPAIVLAVLVLYGFNTWTKVMSGSGTAEVQAMVDLHESDPDNKFEDKGEIEVVAYQWGWYVRYPGPDGILGKHDYTNISTNSTPPNLIGLDTNDVHSYDDIIVEAPEAMHLIEGQDVRLLIRSRDVLHAVWMPQMYVQMYAMPGTPTHFRFKPTVSTERMRDSLDDEDFDFIMLCNQICGSAHYNMGMDVRVESKEEFNEWIRTMAPFHAEKLDDKRKAFFTSLAEEDNSEEKAEAKSNETSDASTEAEADMTDGAMTESVEGVAAEAQQPEDEKNEGENE